MKGYRAFFKGTKRDPDERPSTWPKETRWLLSREAAEREAEVLDAKHHDSRYRFHLKEADVEAYDVRWYDRVERAERELRFYAPLKEGGHVAAHRHLTGTLGSGKFSIKSVSFVQDAKYSYPPTFRKP